MENSNKFCPINETKRIKKFIFCEIHVKNMEKWKIFEY